MNEKQDIDNEFDSGADDFSADSDFGEFDSRPDKGSLSDAFKNNPVVKIGLAAAAALVIVGAIALFGGSETEAPESVVSGGNEIKDTPGQSELTPEMKQVMEDYEKQKLED